MYYCTWFTCDGRQNCTTYRNVVYDLKPSVLSFVRVEAVVENGHKVLDSEVALILCMEVLPVLVLQLGSAQRLRCHQLEAKGSKAGESPSTEIRGWHHCLWRWRPQQPLQMFHAVSLSLRSPVPVAPAGAPPVRPLLRSTFSATFLCLSVILSSLHLSLPHLSTGLIFNFSVKLLSKEIVQLHGQKLKNDSPSDGFVDSIEAGISDNLWLKSLIEQG